MQLDGSVDFSGSLTDITAVKSRKGVTINFILLTLLFLLFKTIEELVFVKFSHGLTNSHLLIDMAKIISSF